MQDFVPKQRSDEHYITLTSCASELRVQRKFLHHFHPRDEIGNFILLVQSTHGQYS